MTLPPMPVSLRDVRQREEHGRRVLAVTNPNMLTQTVGWLKFSNSSGPVLYRGQTELYPNVIASGFRKGGISSRRSLAARLRKYITAISGTECSCASGPYQYGQAQLCDEKVRGRSPSSLGLVKGTFRAAIEPLTQHYGVATRWLDVVDNIWIALWFACHRQITVGHHAHHQRRSEGLEGPGASAYITVLTTGAMKPTRIPGYHVGDSIRLIDLRYAVPSVYLRPHAQHGLLVAPGKLDDEDPVDLNRHVVAEIEINLTDALMWLGNGMMTSSFVLFPPATMDEGYRKLLAAPDPPEPLGKILQYGSGS